MADELTLSTLRPAERRKARKRVGRGLGSGKGRYSGRGIKGQKARSGSHRMRPGFEGGQMPVYMRVGKQRGPTSKDAMPIGPHRTATQPVNVGDLARAFRAGSKVTLEALVEKGLVKNLRVDVKVLGDGELQKKLTVTAHRFSKTAREKIEAAGGTVVALREGTGPKRRRRRSAPAAAAETVAVSETLPETEEPEATEAETADAEAGEANG